MPQPISIVNPSASIFLGNNTDNPSDNRPQLALLAMKMLSEWSILEAFMHGLFVQMLGANPIPGAAMYTALSGGQAQRDVFKAVAAISLSATELEIFEAIFALYATAAKERNKVAHWVWGWSPDISDGVILVDPDIMMIYRARMVQYAQEISDIKVFWEKHPRVPTLPLDRTFVFYEHDFRGTSERIRRLMVLVTNLTFLINPNHPMNRDGQLFARLHQEPEILEYVTRSRQRQKNNP